VKKIKITFCDEWEFDDDATNEDMYDMLLDWLAACVKCEDVTCFDFEEISE
jgi:hypothetical protein